jgi:hypothetical protein
MLWDKKNYKNVIHLIKNRSAAHTMVHYTTLFFFLAIAQTFATIERERDFFRHVYCKDKDNDTSLHEYETVEDWIHNTMFLEPITEMYCTNRTLSKHQEQLLTAEFILEQRSGRQMRYRQRQPIRLPARKTQREALCKVKQGVICPVAKIKCGVCSFFAPSIFCGIFCLQVNTLCELAVLVC